MTNPVTEPAGTGRSRAGRALFLSSILAFAGCNSSDSTTPPADIPTTPDPVVGEHDPLPGVVVDITGLSGGSGANGNFQVGDVITVTFTLKRRDGVPLELSGLTRTGIMVSGPTYNYQRVIASVSDVQSRAVKLAVDTWRYTFASPIPASYLAPLNDTTNLTIGEMTGQPLAAGTYTVGMEMRKDYTIDGTVYRDVGNTSEDFLVGGATTLEPREVVTLANCNLCHTRLSAHGGNRTEITNCLLCHTAGAEDRNTASVANGTPGVTIDFKVMIHKIHAGAYLPSVLGVTTDNTGARDYAATQQPYEMIGFGDSLIDFSHVVFPAWPSFYTPMPRDTGYTALTSGQQGLENSMRRMPVDCSKCHGDPDGSGPLPAPAQEELIYAQPSRLACGSCHDDWVWDRPYTANQMTMPAQHSDAVCKDCHTATDNRAYHQHPLADATVATGLNIRVTSVTDVGNGDGHFDAGERIQMVFDVVDDQGAPVAASSMTRLEYTLSGPTENPQFLTYGRLALTHSSLAGNGPYTVNVPDIVYLEPIGTSTGALETFATARAPHWNVTSGSTTQPTTLLRRTGTGASTTMAAAGDVAQNYIDVVDATGFANTNYIVVDDGTPGSREYLRVQWVDGTRLWFGTVYTTNANYKPGLTINHAAGTSVTVVTTSAVAAGNWTLDPLSGVITETTEFGAGEILASYWTDYVVPSVYPGSIYNTQDQRGDYGDWQGLALLNGTYALDLHGASSFSVNPTGTEATSYTQGAPSVITRLLFGNATAIEAPARVEGAALCNKCHNDIQFHGGSRRGFDTCIGCHGTVAVEDAPRYTGSHTQAQTPTFTAEFRVVLHELHEGVFPAMPGGTMQCAACHGENNDAWKQPAERLHPNQTLPTRAWGLACGSCHTSNAATGHIEAMTSPSGYETCALCHGQGKDKPVEFSHQAR